MVRVPLEHRGDCMVQVLLRLPISWRPELKSMKEKRVLNLFVLIDALGWPYVQEQDFLSEILPYRYSLRTVLGFSSGAIPTILTGQLPTNTGHWNLFYYDPQG